MTQEEKQLLLKDLCARSYYQPFVQLNPGAYNKSEKCWICGISGEDIYLNVDSDPFSLRNFNILPYLRSMSSMTEEEKYIYRHMLGATLNSEGESIMFVYVEDFPTVIDWLNAHHFDYRGLIEKGLALEAPEGMYKIE